MRSFLLASLSTVAAGAAIQQRDAVPAGYVAPPYYPGPFSKLIETPNEPFPTAALY